MTWRDLLPRDSAAGPPRPAFLAAFAAEAQPATAETGGPWMAFAGFMQLALYHPGAGYYRADRERVGTGRGTDFFTAASVGPIFGELVAAAAVHLLGGRDPAGVRFIECGAERGRSVLAEVAHPFGEVATLGVEAGGQEWDRLLAGEVVVFSNELFDAQPCRRFLRLEGAWRELGVALAGGDLAWCLVPAGAGAAPPSGLPDGAEETTLIDAPVAACRLLERLLAPAWRGPLLALDYGLAWEAIATERPRGTARAYHRHRMVDDLLARPGEQDLTCHVCWDWLEETLRASGARQVERMSQERFLVRLGGEALQRRMRPGPGGRNADARRLHQLLHPGLMGQKFEALVAVR